MMREALLGFQIRVAPEQLPPWQLNRRSTYLLQESVLTPLSVDTAVWPIDDDETVHSALFADGDRTVNGLNVRDLCVPAMLGPRNPCRPAVLIAITVADEHAMRLRAQHAITIPGPVLGDLGREEWSRIGFDIADGWMTSALSNCGFSASSKTELQHRFNRCVNAVGLFDDASVADEFRALSDARIPEHSPFYTFGIWRYA